MANKRLSKGKRALILSVLQGNANKCFLPDVQCRQECRSARDRRAWRGAGKLSAEGVLELDEQWQYVGIHGQRIRQKEKGRLLGLHREGVIALRRIRWSSDNKLRTETLIVR